MNVAKNLQREHEKAVCSKLIKIVSPRLSFERMGNDQTEPDVLYKIDDGSIIGIEVGTAYYTNSDAEQEWTLARGERKIPSIGYELRHGGGLKNTDELICSKIQKELEDKCLKQYSGVSESWLCIEARSALSDKASFTKCISGLNIPEDHTFRNIILFYLAPKHDGGGHCAVKIC